MLSNPVSPLSPPVGKELASVEPHVNDSTQARRMIRVNWRWVGIIVITLALFLNGTYLARWVYAQDGTLLQASIAGTLGFVLPRLVIWLTAHI